MRHICGRHNDPDFEGDYTVVLFTLTKTLKKSPDKIGQELGAQLVANYPAMVTAYNVIKGFLNLTISDEYWTNFLHANFSAEKFGFRQVAPAS